MKKSLLLIVFCLFSLVSFAQNPIITQIEFFYDTDPGFGNANQISFSQGSTVDLNFTLDISNLSPGIHSMFIRAKDENDKWSLYTKRNIYIIDGLSATPNIVELEYFFDTDPGPGAGTSLSVTTNTEIDENYIIPLSNLTDGDHELFIRAKDAFGRWSLYSQGTVHIGNWNCEYSDAPMGHEAYDAVTDLCNRGLLVNDGLCEPEDLITRAALAKLTYLSIELQNNPTADDFPSPFNDLQSLEDSWYYSFAKNLAYLEFDDHKSPFDRDFFNFLPANEISRAHTLKVLLEAWNIDETSNSGINPFTDVTVDDDTYNYIVKAVDLGIIDDNETHLFKPNNGILRKDVFIMLHKMLTVIPLTIPTITDNDFFIPGNYKPDNFASFAGMHSGNFNHYTKTSFAIASVGIPLSYEHTYNSYLSEMPGDLIPLQPLGKMWNHTYNSYIKEVPGDVERPNDFRIVVALPNSGYHIYKAYGGGFTPVTNGVYNTLLKPTADKFTITTKSQIVYTYQKIAGTHESFPYVLISIHDRNGNTLAINYEDSQDPKVTDYKRIKEVVGTSGRKLLFNYHPNSDLVNFIEDPLNRKVNYTYNPEGKLISFKDAKNQETIYNYGTTYAEEDLLMSIQLPKGNTVTNTYDKKKLTSSQTNGSQPTTYNYVRNYGQIAHDNFIKTTVVSPETNQTTVLDYNKDGNPNHILKDNTTNIDIGYHPNQSNKPTSIDIDGKNASITYDDMGNALSVGLPMGISYVYDYNNFNDITQYTDPKGFTYDYQYNGTGNLTQSSTPRGAINYTVNSKGLVTSVSNPMGITTSYVYDDYGNVTQTDAPEGISTQASYDIVSRLKSFTNPNGRSITYQYDPNDNLEQELFNGHSTGYTFDPNDNLTKITNANGVPTDMVYDFDNDFLESVQFGAATDGYTYYEDGKIKTYTNPNGDIFTYGYDTEGRLITVSTTGETIIYTYDTHNNIETLTNNHGTIQYSYDALNRITSTTDDYNNVVGYEYDANNNVKKITYPGPKEVNYTYYDDNLLESVTDWNSQTTTYTYRNDGLLSNISYPNGTYCDYVYDNAGRNTGLSWKNSSNVVINEYTHTLDPMGNHLSENKTEPFTPSSLPDDTVNYTYNNTNQLQTANGANNVSFGYDTNGNTISKTENTYTFDKHDNLKTIAGTITAQYEYDGAGNRRKSSINGTEKRYVLDILGMSKVLMETDNANAVDNYYVYGLGLISRIDASNQTRYYHYDFRGSTIAMTDEIEAITHKYEYNDFGQTLQSDEADFNAYRYVGKYGVAYEDTELYFMRARYYDPSVGRFISEDPIWSTNLYPYADNNPLTGIDPKGENKDLLSFAQNSYRIYKSSEIDNVRKANTESSKATFGILLTFLGAPPGVSTLIEISDEEINAQLFYEKIPKELFNELTYGLTSEQFRDDVFHPTEAGKRNAEGIFNSINGPLINENTIFHQRIGNVLDNINRKR